MCENAQVVSFHEKGNTYVTETGQNDVLAKLISGLHYYSSVPAQMLPQSLHVNSKNPEAGA